MPTVKLSRHGGGYLLETSRKFACGLDRDDSEWTPAEPISNFYQSDWDFPMLASMLGKPVTCCSHTDGTVECPDHKVAVSDMISKACDFIDDMTGTIDGLLGNELYRWLLEVDKNR